MHKFKFKNNVYGLMDDGSYRIRSNANVDGRGYTWFYVTDEYMIDVLTTFLGDVE